MCVFEVILFTFNAPIMLALPAFNAVLAVNILPITLVTADSVPTFAVLACTVLTMLADAPFNAPLDVTVPPIRLVLATITSILADPPSILPITLALPAFS